MARDELVRLFRLSSEVGEPLQAKCGPRDALLVLCITLGRVAWRGMRRDPNGRPHFREALECWRWLVDGEKCFSFFALGFDSEADVHEAAGKVPPSRKGTKPLRN